MSYKTPGQSRGHRRSDGVSKLISINEGTDLMESDKHYPPTVLPTVKDLCELAETQRDIYESLGEELEGATLDIADAYRQFTVSLPAILHRTVMLTIKGTKYIVFALTGWFGDTRAGHCYNLFGSYIDFKHNQSISPAGRIRSLTYVDDGMLIDAKSKLQSSRSDYEQHAVEICGPNAVETRKNIYHGQDLECIGWRINLRYNQWRVSPKIKAVDKIFTALFF